MPFISVIIPVYNTDRYLGECLDSVLSQTMSSIEVICINDGSTDESLSIMRRYEDADSRVRVIDKPNGGYGNAVNRGLDAARGRYVSIIEPDDFIDAHMLEDLFSAACRSDGTYADVVKSSYWNYYDLEGESPRIEAPNLMNCMPSESFEFNVHEHWEVLYHHPSIWSAIYRRSFLEERGIRMIEPKGAGWADNPFFFETLLQARSIVWVPAAYYYYRQTNPDASSNLKDYHLPFDRLRDIRALLERLGENDPHVLVCFYNRIFSYVGSVVGEFGFPESDPEIMGLIREAFSFMDEGVLYSAKRGIHKDHIAYYEDVMGVTSQSIPERGSVEFPLVSVVIPMHDCRPLLWRTFSSVVAQELESIEVICVDCASSDRSYEVACDVAARDGRFRAVSCDAEDMVEGCNTGLDLAAGRYVYFLLPGMEVPRRLLSVVSSALEERKEAPLCVFAKSPRFMGSAFAEGGRSALVETKGSLCPLVLSDGGVLGVSSKMFRTSFLKEAGVRFEDAETEQGLLFCLRSFFEADRVLVLRKARINDERLRLEERGAEGAFGRFSADMHMLEEMERYADSVGDDETSQAFRCCAVSLLECDMRRYCATSDGERIYAASLDAFSHRFGISQHGGMYFLNQGAYRHLQRALFMGYQQFVQRELMLASSNAAELRNRNRSIKDSGSYRFGRAVSKMARKMLPRSVISRISRR